jgi:hypothetical protein
MSSIPVISHNVIRQAIEWHGLPSPQRAMTLSNFAFPSGKSQATVVLIFETLDLFKHYTGVQLKDDNLFGFKNDLQNCFCRDIVVVQIDVNSTRGTTSVYLSCILEKHPS